MSALIQKPQNPGTILNTPPFCFILVAKPVHIMPPHYLKSCLFRCPHSSLNGPRFIYTSIRVVFNSTVFYFTSN